jgi:hypothetical protein
MPPHSSALDKGKRQMIDTTEQIASVIDRTNQLEVQINLALSECIVPVSTEYGFVRETLFHNLCLGFGAKVRLLQRIRKRDALKILS